MLVSNTCVIYNSECWLKSVSNMNHYELQRQLVFSKLYPQTFGGQDYISITEQLLGVFNKQLPRSLVHQYNKRRNIKKEQKKTLEISTRTVENVEVIKDPRKTMPSVL